MAPMGAEPGSNPRNHLEKKNSYYLVKISILTVEGVIGMLQPSFEKRKHFFFSSSEKKTFFSKKKSEIVRYRDISF